jgi:hypothetical protein
MGMRAGGGGGGGIGSRYSRMNQQAVAQQGGQGDPRRGAGLRAPVQAQGGYAQTQSPVNRGNPPPPQNMASQQSAFERAQQPGAILDPAGAQGQAQGQVTGMGNQYQQRMQMQRAQAGAMRRPPPNPTGNRMPMGGGGGGRYGAMMR